VCICAMGVCLSCLVRVKAEMYQYEFCVVGKVADPIFFTMQGKHVLWPYYLVMLRRWLFHMASAALQVFFLGGTGACRIVGGYYAIAQCTIHHWYKQCFALCIGL